MKRPTEPMPHMPYGHYDDDLDVSGVKAALVQYLGEGHLVSLIYIDPDRAFSDPEAEVWFASCTCGDGSYYEGEAPSPDLAPVLRTKVDASWWHRGHRTMHGLDWQRVALQDPLRAWMAERN